MDPFFIRKQCPHGDIDLGGKFVSPALVNIQINSLYDSAYTKALVRNISLDLTQSPVTSSKAASHRCWLPSSPNLRTYVLSAFAFKFEFSKGFLPPSDSRSGSGHVCWHAQSPSFNC